MATLKRVRQTLNPGLEITGIVLTMFDERTRLSKDVVSEVRRHFGDRVYQTIVPRNIRLAEAPSHGIPVLQYDIKSRGAQAYLGLAREMLPALAADPKSPSASVDAAASETTSIESVSIGETTDRRPDR